MADKNATDLRHENDEYLKAPQNDAEKRLLELLQNETVRPEFAAAALREILLNQNDKNGPEEAYKSPEIEDAQKVSHEDIQQQMQRAKEAAYESGKLPEDRLSPEQQRLIGRYKEEYDRYVQFPNTRKTTISWDEFKRRLLANNGKYLHLVENLQFGGTFFGLDKDGNLLFADRGNLVMKGQDYYTTRNAVYYKKFGDKTILSGYEMFPGDELVSGNGAMQTALVGLYEANTGQKFIEKDCSAWLDSGEGKESWFQPQCVDGSGGISYCGFHDFPRANENRGTRRLVRVAEY